MPAAPRWQARPAGRSSDRRRGFAAAVFLTHRGSSGTSAVAGAASVSRDLADMGPCLRRGDGLIVVGSMLKRAVAGANTRRMMWAIATAARSFLQPQWRRWHETWGPPAPQTLSQWTCVRSSLLLTDTFERRGISAGLRSGRGDGFGIRVAGCWESHAWVEADGRLIDITADQFGYAPVIVARFDHPAYRPAQHSLGQLAPSRAAVDAIAEIWPAWSAYLAGLSG